MISKKVILTGNFGVGKTSLFNQFIFSKFSDKYLTTIGVKVNKKVMVVDDVEVSILLWDIAGEVTQDKVPNSYFLGASGIIYVYDLSRPITANNIASDLAYLNEHVKGCPVKVVGNKEDLLSAEQKDSVIKSVTVPTDYTTSAKTGANVEQLFEDLARYFIAQDSK